MNTPSSQESGINTPDRKPPIQNDDKVEIAGGGVQPGVSPEMAKKVVRKLDIRIIPAICWVYLMNFMDRGQSSAPSTAFVHCH